jgi:hypothetical protein
MQIEISFEFQAEIESIKWRLSRNHRLLIFASRDCFISDRIIRRVKRNQIAICRPMEVPNVNIHLPPFYSIITNTFLRIASRTVFSTAASNRNQLEECRCGVADGAKAGRSIGTLSRNSKTPTELHGIG